jgi:thioredoxin reductase
MAMETDVLIIGAGPAGLAAAFETASRGLDVTIVDESISAGGQLPQQTQTIRALSSSYEPMRGFELAEKLTEQLKEFPVRFLLKHRVIGLYADGSVGITDEENVFPVKSKKIIVATGAAESAVAFPKWTLPGVMTIGAAQTLVNRDFVIPGNDAVILGSSDFAMDVALQLLEVGVNIKGIVESQTQVKSSEREKVEQIERSGVPFYLSAFINEARGNGEIEEIDIKHEGKVITEKVDLLCVDGGRTPILDSFYQLGCSFGYQEELGGWVPQYNRRFQTDLEDVFLAGNAAGISAQGVLIVTGMIAGISTCEALEAISKEDAEEIRDSLWKEVEILEHKDVLEARIYHIQNFNSPKLKDQFIS